MSLPAPLTLLLPVLVTVLSGLLSHDRAPQWANAIIAFLVVVGCSIGAAYLDQRLTPDLIGNFVVIAGYSAALMASPILQPLYQWLKVNTPSPLAVLASPLPTLAAQGTTSSAVTPAAARASALPAGQSYVKPPLAPPTNRPGWVDPTTQPIPPQPPLDTQG